ncbi:major facilitator superfamily domain-containing protein [Staphylotrichum tortipilum]|uniref:Major facilitator superfamily domain-containing protein n=1 Tax=Staphylotrichum tortipilum TaxID=2831512 RepID=A0AAN6RTF5_9PEZI|nr:major facilitator superfamily domain-containing protein [Staphylotrichum longicolle]
MHYDQLFPRSCPVQTEDRFPKFQRLPPEIRNMIWEFALPEARVYEVLDAPNAKQKTPAREGLMFANVHPEPPPALAAVCRESRSFVLHHYKPLTLGKTTKFVDMSRDILLLEPYLLVKRLHRTLHFMSQLPLVRDHATQLALGTSYGIYPGIFHPVLGRKVSKNNMSKLLASLAKFPRLRTLVFVVHQEFQFEFDFRFPGTLTPMPNYTPAGYPSPPSSSGSGGVHQAYRFKFDIESNINSPSSARRPHTNELLYYPLSARGEWDEFDEYECYVKGTSGGGGMFGRASGAGGKHADGHGNGGDNGNGRWFCAATAAAAGGEDAGGDAGEEEDGEWCDPWPTNDDWKRFRRSILLAGKMRVAYGDDDGNGNGSGSGSGSLVADLAKDVTEHTPLLANDASTASNSGHTRTVQGDNGDNDGDDIDDKPLPVWQIAALCYARWVEPVAFFSIFPYINEMVQKNGQLADTDAGFYSGLIESLFSLTQMFVMIMWGRAADRFGRKPVLLFSLVGVSFATALFGLARTIPQMMLFRCFAGVFAGSIVTIRTMISEHSTSKTQARAFSWFAFTGNLGILFGPLIGGALANPARQYSGLFGNVAFFRDYPYALPSLVVGAMGLSAVAVTAICVEETLVRKPSGGGGEESAAGPKPDDYDSTWNLLKVPGVPVVLYTYGHIMLLAYSYTAIVSVFWYTKVYLGGFGFTALQISLMMGLTGLAQSVWILLVFPPLHHRIGTNGVLKACAAAYPFFFVFCPLFNLLLRIGTPAAVSAFWIVAPTLLALGCGVSMSFTAIQLALNDVSPSPATLGTLNALALAIVSGVRSFSPALFAGLFAVGARTQLLWGYAIWVLMVAIALGFTAVSRYMPDYDEMKRAREREAWEPSGTADGELAPGARSVLMLGATAGGSTAQ